MPIPGVYGSPETTSHQLQLGVQPEVARAVATTLRLFDTLQILDSMAEATKALTDQYTDLAGLGLKGRLYPELISEQAPFESLVAAIESKCPIRVNSIARDHVLWTPGTRLKSFTKADLDGNVSDYSVRIALFNTKNTGVDPLLHHLNLPYDQHAKERRTPKAKTTQLDAIERDKKIFDSQYPGYILTQLGARATLTLVLMDRIDGVNPSSNEYVLNKGFIRTELSRRNVGGSSVVGYVSSINGRLYLNGGSGCAEPNFGVGISAGRV